MEVQTIRNKSQMSGKLTLNRGIFFGLIGGLAGTVAMDIVMAVEYSMLNLPLTTSYAVFGSIVGSGVAVGVILHLLVGSISGIIFGALAVTLGALRISSVRRGVWLGVLFGVVTIPLGCVPTALITGIPILEFVSVSAVPHIVFGVILGAIAGYGLRVKHEDITK